MMRYFLRTKNFIFLKFGIFFLINCLLQLSNSIASETYCGPTSYWTKNFGIDNEADLIAFGKIDRVVWLGVWSGKKPTEIRIDRDQYFTVTMISLVLERIFKGNKTTGDRLNVLTFNECSECTPSGKQIKKDLKFNNDVIFFVDARSLITADRLGPSLSIKDTATLRRNGLSFEYSSFYCSNRAVTRGSPQYFHILNLLGHDD